MSAFYGNMSYYPPFHEDHACVPSYQPSHTEQLAGLIPNVPITLDYQQSHHVFHPPIPAQSQYQLIYNQNQPREEVFYANQHDYLYNQPQEHPYQHVLDLIKNLDHVLWALSQKLEHMKISDAGKVFSHMYWMLVDIKKQKRIISQHQELANQSFIYDQERVTKIRQFEESLEGEIATKEEQIKSLSAQVQSSQTYFDY